MSFQVSKANYSAHCDLFIHAQSNSPNVPIFCLSTETLILLSLSTENITHSVDGLACRSVVSHLYKINTLKKTNKSLI